MWVHGITGDLKYLNKVISCHAGGCVEMIVRHQVIRGDHHEVPFPSRRWPVSAYGRDSTNTTMELEQWCRAEPYGRDMQATPFSLVYMTVHLELLHVCSSPPCNETFSSLCLITLPRHSSSADITCFRGLAIFNCTLSQTILSDADLL